MLKSIYVFDICHIDQVQRWRVRDVMLQMDPAGAALRGLLKKPHRRIYRVAGPNSLWHVDGNHKLIRYYYCMYIHTYAQSEVFDGSTLFDI